MTQSQRTKWWPMQPFWRRLSRVRPVLPSVLTAAIFHSGHFENVNIWCILPISSSLLARVTVLLLQSDLGLFFSARTSQPGEVCYSLGMQKWKFCFCFFFFFSLVGTRASPAEQLSMALAWDRTDIAQKDILVSGQHWQVRLKDYRGGVNSSYYALKEYLVYIIIKLCTYSSHSKCPHLLWDQYSGSCIFHALIFRCLFIINTRSL